MSTLQVSRDLSALRAWAMVEIDRLAEGVRQTEITPGDGQMLVYEDKRNEAQDVDTKRAIVGTLDPGDYPLLQVDMAIDGLTLLEAADQVLARYAAWKQMAAAIENIRRGQKEMVKVSDDPAAIEAAPSAMSLTAVLTLLSV